MASWHVGLRAIHSCDPARCGAFAAIDHCAAPERREPIPSQLFKVRHPARWHSTGVDARAWLLLVLLACPGRLRSAVQSSPAHGGRPSASAFSWLAGLLTRH